jgi:ubiquinone/menaquinone biosynthesis C-methylase UbiE
MLRHGLLRHWLDLFELNYQLRHRNDIFRNIEDSFVLKYGEFSQDDKILDIGCGDSTVPSFIRLHYRSEVHVIDIDIRMLESQRRYMDQLKNEIIIEEQDATNLSYPDSSFTRVIAESSIEHIPGDGDTRSIREFSRILKPGGKCLITVPFGKYEEVDHPWYYAGFERRYDMENLQKRLLVDDNLKVETLLFMSSPESPFIEEIYAKVGNIFEVYYRGNYHNTADRLSIGLTLGWIELTEVPRSSFGALLCLKKKG